MIKVNDVYENKNTNTKYKITATDEDRTSCVTWNKELNTWNKSAYTGSTKSLIEQIKSGITILLRPDSITALTSDICNHEFKYYHGLIETYEYCSKCDEKREVA